VSLWLPLRAKRSKWSFSSLLPRGSAALLLGPEGNPAAHEAAKELQLPVYRSGATKCIVANVRNGFLIASLLLTFAALPSFCGLQPLKQRSETHTRVTPTHLHTHFSNSTFHALFNFFSASPCPQLLYDGEGKPPRVELRDLISLFSV